MSLPLIAPLETGNHTIGFQGGNANVEEPEGAKESGGDYLVFPGTAQFATNRAAMEGMFDYIQ